MLLVLCVAFGGALGAVARFGLSGWVHGWAGTSLPWGTLAANLLGAFCLGAALRTLEFATVSPEVRAGVTVGFLGAFTTFSTYSYETLVLVQDGEWGRATAYGVGSLILGLIFVAAGFAAAHLIHSARGG